MVTFLITSVLVLGLIAIAIYFWQKPTHQSEPIELPPPYAAGLFTNSQAEQLETADAESGLLTETEAVEQPEQDDGVRKAAEEALAAWQASPDRKTTAEMLHLAATADDADTFRQAVEAALSTWQQGRISDLSAAELQNLFTSEFWLLSSRTRSSGAGFVLKQTLSRATRELGRANNPT